MVAVLQWVPLGPEVEDTPGSDGLSLRGAGTYQLDSEVSGLGLSRNRLREVCYIG